MGYDMLNFEGESIKWAYIRGGMRYMCSWNPGVAKKEEGEEGGGVWPMPRFFGRFYTLHRVPPRDSTSKEIIYNNNFEHTHHFIGHTQWLLPKYPSAEILITCVRKFMQIALSVKPFCAGLSFKVDRPWTLHYVVSCRIAERCTLRPCPLPSSSASQAFLDCLFAWEKIEQN